MRGNTRSVDKAKDFKQAIRKLFSTLKPYRWMILIAIILVIVSTVCSLIGPNRLSEVTDIIEQGVSVNIDLSNEKRDELFDTGSATIESENYTFILTYQKNVLDDNSDDVILLSINSPENILGTANFKNLEENGYVEFTDRNMGIGYSEGVISIWLNTETQVNVDKIFKICMTLTVLYLVAFMVNYCQGFIMATVNQRVSKNLRSQISYKINRLPFKYFDSNSYGEVLSRVTNDVDTIGQALNNSVSTIIGAFALFIGALIMMFVTNWVMALAGVLATILGFSIMLVIIKKSQKHFVAQQRVLGRVNGLVEEAYSGQEIIKAYNAEQETEELFNKENSKLYTSAWKSQFYSGLMQPVMGFVGNLGNVVVCVVGAVMVYYGIINFAVIIAIMIYIRLFTQPLAQMAQGVTNLQSALAASERVHEFLDQPELSDESHLDKRLDKVKGNVEFRHVKFGYDPDRIIIKDFSAKIKAGQKVAIVGPTGAGKTTLVNLLMKFYDTLDGEILIDGVPISELTRANVHDLFGMVLQDTWLFEGSVKENIRYNKPDITDEQIVSACKVAGIHHFIKSLPEGYDTILNDNTNISAGQKQLLTIARAMVENAPMLILDEATSSVDTRTEILIQQAMDKLTENRTSFVIAHRLSTIKNSDIILVMRDGDIVEMGNHEELLNKCGFYADLYNSQFEEVA